MDQSDLDLLQTVPTDHLKSIAKTRHIPISVLEPNKEASAETSAWPSLSSDTILELAGYLFDRTSIALILQELGAFESAILRELVACGGRANSRDLALYLTSAGLLNPSRKASQLSLAHHQPPCQICLCSPHNIHQLMPMVCLRWHYTIF